MNSTARIQPTMTPEEYADWERQQPERHEYFAGELFSQAGGTRRHSLIGTNAARALGNLLKAGDCQVHGSDMRVHIEATGYQAYPDVSVVCPPLEGNSDEVITNPVLLVEVLSPATADFDRGTKFGHYRQIPTLKEYLVFWQDEPRVEQHSRTAEGNWLLREYSGTDAILKLDCLGCSLPMSDVYDKVSFPVT